MKKILFTIIIALFGFFSSYAQLFVAKSLNDAIHQFDNSDDKNLEVWAKNLYNLNFHDNDGNIFFQFVIPAKDSINMARVAVICEYWLDNEKNDRYVTKKFDYANEKVPAVKALVGLGEVGKDNSFKAGFAGIYAHLYSYINLMVELKDNRLRITASMDCYKVGYTGENATSDFFRSIHDLPIVNVPPFTKEKPKDLYLAAYINTHSRALNKISDLINYISSKYREIEEKKEAEEARQNDDW